jgi:hypothetical protein
MLVKGFVTLKYTLRPAVPDFLGKLTVVLLKEFQQSFLLYSDTDMQNSVIHQFGYKFPPLLMVMMW